MATRKPFTPEMAASAALMPQIEQVYATGRIPPLLPPGGLREIAPYVIVEDGPNEG